MLLISPHCSKILVRIDLAAKIFSAIDALGNISASVSRVRVILIVFTHLGEEGEYSSSMSNVLSVL